MRMDPGFHGRALRGLRKWYGSATRWDQWHVRGRFQMAPFRAALETLPGPARILDIGCGHGMMLLLAAAEGRLASGVGIDPDPRKLAAARRATPPVWADRIRWEPGDAGHLPPGPFDRILLMDVLHLIAPGDWGPLFRDVARRLDPEGGVLVLTMADRPGWKASLDRLQEQVAVNWLPLTRGAGPFRHDPGRLVEAMRSAGLKARWSARDGGRLHPVQLVEGAPARSAP